MGYVHTNLLIISHLFLHYCITCMASDNITANQFLKNHETTVSKNGEFTLGFFNPINSTNLYVGIWYSKSPDTVVWVANRNNPLKNPSEGVIRISQNGNLQVLNAVNKTVWSSNISYTTQPPTSLAAQLLDTGNLALTGVDGKIFWQSFEHPTDTVLPNMPLTVNKNSGSRNMLQSWQNASDPSYGRFSVGIDSFAFPQLVIWDDVDGDRENPYWRSGPWIGNNFIGVQEQDSDIRDAGFILYNDRKGAVSLTYSSTHDTILSNYELYYNATLAQKWWDDSRKVWNVLWKTPDNECDFYGKCGAFGTCNALNSPICECLKGFEPKNKVEWSKGNWTDGCTRSRSLQCGNGVGKQDGFYRVKAVKVPDKADWLIGLDQDECRNQCLKNCSCLAYVYETEAGCMSWGKELIDTVELSVGGMDFYLRLAQSELRNNAKVLAIVAATVCVVSIGVASVFILIFLMWRRQYLKQGKYFPQKRAVSNVFGKDEPEFEVDEVPVFTFEKVETATDNFSDSKKLGRGGFGTVYKGILEDGREIAVKRLSRASGQGVKEFMNEVSVISKLQHRNLVRLLGCCVERDEKMLIYEYLPNKSLDFLLFDPLQNELLTWQKRYDIILGISRGLLYLHRDSRLKIIHRDLKASNILLDKDLNPKISDFGTAKIFGAKQDHDDTRRIVGTYGYMSPEYAMEGRFSTKSDVFSFGVLLLEILSGKRNNSFWYEEKSLSFLGYAYTLWSEKNLAPFIDPVIAETCHSKEVEKCMQLGLLCVQESPKDRPTMYTVISMLQSETAKLPYPKQPGFIHCQKSMCIGSFSQLKQQNSVNNVSVTVLTAR